MGFSIRKFHLSRPFLLPFGALSLLLVSGSSAGCNASHATVQAPTPTPTEQRPAVTAFVSKPWGFSTSSYWIEGPTGLIAVDTQFLPSEAERMIAVAEKQTGKRFELAVVLHANPDKFNGTAVFQKHGVKVVTSAQVKALLPDVHARRTKAFYERYAPDYPRELPAPDVFGDQTTELEAAGLRVKLHVLGAGCSEAHVVLEWNRHAFVGDLVGNGVHSWLEIGKTDQWLERLTEIEALHPERLHPGRGASGGPELLANERSYLQSVIQIVAEEKPTLPMPEAGFEHAKAKIAAKYPAYGFPVFLDIGLPAEWARQAQTPTSSKEDK
jgi:glyoxylase-like metal-dependent hydrolase (beta-lactamase superfamily II)